MPTSSADGDEGGGGCQRGASLTSFEHLVPAGYLNVLVHDILFVDNDFQGAARMMAEAIVDGDGDDVPIEAFML